MKTSPRLRPLAAALACALIAHLATVLHAQTATTDPVGFITTTVAGGSATNPKLTLVSPTLLSAVAWQGPIATIAGKTITVAGTPWTANQFNGSNVTYFVEIVSGTGAGAWTDIVTTSTNSITTLDDISSYAAAGVTFKIRKQITISDFLGVNNSAGLNSSTSIATADEVAVYDGSTSTIYWYYNGSDNAGPAGWYDSNYNPAATALIAPHQGVAIKRKVPGSVNITMTGSVKTGNTMFPVQTGLNVLGTVSASGLTLDTSGLYTGNSATGMRGSTSEVGADEVTIYTATGQLNYWYYNAADNAGPAGWYDSNFNPAGSQSIAPGSAIVLNRKAPGVAFNWVLPSPTTF